MPSSASSERQYPSVTVQVTPKPGPSYPTLLTSALAAGQRPEHLRHRARAAHYHQIAEAGHLHDLTGKINIGALLPSATASCTSASKVYALPLLGEYTTGIYYWKPVFAKYKLSIPETWDEFTDAVQDHSEQKQRPQPWGCPPQDGDHPDVLLDRVHDQRPRPRRT